MFEIEAHNMVTCTCKISDENEIKIREYIKKHPDEFQYCSDEEAIIIAIKNLKLIYIAIMWKPILIRWMCNGLSTRKDQQEI